MEQDEPCGAPTRTGTPCKWPRSQCPHAWHRGHGRAAKSPRPAPAYEPTPAGVAPPVPSAVLDARDLHGLGWWLVRETLGGNVDRGTASVVVSAMRILANLDAPPADTAALQQETELRARLMHGLPPRTDDEWALAGRLFTDEAVEEMRRWDEPGASGP